MRIIAAVAQAVGTCRNQLQAAEPLVHLVGAGSPENPGHPHHHERAKQEAQQGRHEDERHCLQNAGGHQSTRTGLGNHRTHDAADEGVRRAAGNAVVPGDDVPGDGTYEGAKHHVRIHHARLHDALAHRSRHAEVEHKNRDEVEECREQHCLRRLEHTSGDHRGNRVGRIVEPVHEVEQERQRDEQNHNPQGCLYGFHVSQSGGSGVFEDDALDAVGHVFTLVGDGFQQLVNGLELDDFTHIRLFAEQLAHGAAHHAVSI